MDHYVTVCVSGRIIPEDPGAADEIEIVSGGEYFERGGSRYILYEEVMPEFEEPVRNVLRISDGYVGLRKRGLVVSDLVFREGAACTTHYVTPFGNLMLGITTKQLLIEEEENKIDIRIKYDAELNYEKTGECTIHIKINGSDDDIEI